MTVKSNQKLKKVLFLFWILLIASFFISLISSDTKISDYPHIIADTVASHGVWAPIVFIVLFAIRPFVLFPATILSLTAGILFGPVRAVLVLIIAENLSSLVAYNIGRFFWKDHNEHMEHKYKTVKKLESFLHSNEFISILVLRLVFFPFDILGYIAGAVRICYWNFAIATFIGILPGLIVSAFLSGSIYNSKYLAVAALSLLFSIGISKILKTKFGNKIDVNLDKYEA